MVRIAYRKIYDEYGLEVLKSKREIPPKMVKNDRPKIMSDFHIHSNEMVMANQPDILVVNKLQEKTAVTDVAIPSDSNIKKKEPKKLAKY